jgi:zinc transporter
MSDDGSAFVHAFLLDGRGSGRAVEPKDIEQWTPNRELLWVHIDMNRAASRHWLRDRDDVDEITEDALLAAETRPRAVASDRGLLLVLRGVNTNPGADPDDMVAVRIWVESNRIISCRRRKLLSVQDIAGAIEAGRGPRTPGGFVVMLVENLAERIGDVVEQIEGDVETAENESGQADSSTIRSEVGALRRQTAAIRRYLAPQREALDRLYRHPGPIFTEQESDALREQADRTTRYLEDLELVRERGIVLQEELMNRMAQEQNSRIYLLSIIAAIFLPLTFVTGLLGMNVAGLPGTSNPSAFSLSVLIMAALGIGLAAFFKWKRWLCLLQMEALAVAR